jgi:hypothetical protein
MDYGHGACVVSTKFCLTTVSWRLALAAKVETLLGDINDFNSSAKKDRQTPIKVLTAAC